MKSIAEQIGETPHLSPLLRRLRQLGFANPDDLRRLAVKRGRQHYRRPDDDLAAVVDPGLGILSNVELAVALVSGAQQFDPVIIRCAAQILSGDGIALDRLVHLARQERAVPALRHIARAGVEADEIGRDTWQQVLDKLPTAQEIPDGRLPHRTRFVSETGLAMRDRKLDRSGHKIWLRPGKHAHAR